MSKGASQVRAALSGRPKKPAKPRRREALPHRHARELLAFGTLARALAAPHDRPAMLARAIQTLTSTTRAHAPIIFVMDETSQALDPEAATGLPAIYEIRLVENVAIRAIRSGRVFRHSIARGLFADETRAALETHGFASEGGGPIFLETLLLPIVFLLYRTGRAHDVSDTLLA